MDQAKVAGDDVGVITVIGQLVTAAGHVNQVDATGDPVPYTLPAVGYLRDQAAGLPMLFDHDHTWVIGEVGHLERSRADGLMMVGRIADDGIGDLLADGDWWLSDGVACRPTGPLEKGHARLREVSLVRRTANVATRPIHWSRADIARDGGGAPHNMPLNWYSTWARAHDRMSSYAYRRADRMVIHDLDRLDHTDEILTDPGAARRRAAPALPVPAPAPVPCAGPRVRLHGVLLDERRSAEWLDAYEFGCATTR